MWYIESPTHHLWDGPKWRLSYFDRSQSHEFTDVPMFICFQLFLLVQHHWLPNDACGALPVSIYTARRMCAGWLERYSRVKHQHQMPICIYTHRRRRIWSEAFNFEIENFAFGWAVSTWNNIALFARKERCVHCCRCEKSFALFPPMVIDASRWKLLATESQTNHIREKNKNEERRFCRS